MGLVGGANGGGLNTSGSAAWSPAPLAGTSAVVANGEEARQRTGTQHLNLENLRQVIEDNGEKLKTLFEMWDEDASGTINAAEFRNALGALGFHEDEAHMNAMFNKLDKDKSGQLDYKELTKAVKGAGKKAKALIASERKLLEEKRAHQADAAAIADAQVQAQQATQQAAEHSKQLEQQLEDDRQQLQRLQQQLEQEEEARRAATREAEQLRDEIDELKRTVGQWERKAAAWEASDADRQKQLRTAEAASEASRVELERFKTEEVTILKQTFEAERQTWTEQKEKEVAAVAKEAKELEKLNDELEKRKTEENLRVALANAILTSAADGQQRDDSLQFWQARRLNWRHKAAPAQQTPPPPEDGSAVDAARLAQSINSQLGRLAEQLSTGHGASPSLPAQFPPQFPPQLPPQLPPQQLPQLPPQQPLISPLSPPAAGFGGCGGASSQWNAALGSGGVLGGGAALGGCTLGGYAASSGLGSPPSSCCYGYQNGMAAGAGGSFAPACGGAPRHQWVTPSAQYHSNMGTPGF